MKTITNLNLNRINKKIIFLCFAVVFFSKAYSQSKSTLLFGAGINGGVGSAIINSTAYDQYLDSSKSTTVANFNRGAHLWVFYSLGKKFDLQIGLGYQQTGFSRKQSGLTFNSPTYPGIGTGKIEDLSNTPKELTYNYRFSYLQIPVIINYYLAHSGDYKWMYYFVGGITPQILLKHQLIANTNSGFMINGEKTFKLDSSGFNARTFAISLQLGMNIEFRAEKNKAYFLQPVVGIYPLSVTNGKNSVYPFYFSINVGMLFSNFKK